jgi:large subunit ribosomal protein L10
VLKRFITEKQKLEVKVGILEKKVMGAAELSALADLPSFDALRAQFLGMLMQTAASFVRVVDAKVKAEEKAA